MRPSPIHRAPTASPSNHYSATGSPSSPWFRSCWDHPWARTSDIGRASFPHQHRADAPAPCAPSFGIGADGPPPTRLCSSRPPSHSRDRDCHFSTRDDWGSTTRPPRRRSVRPVRQRHGALRPAHQTAMARAPPPRTPRLPTPSVLTTTRACARAPTPPRRW